MIPVLSSPKIQHFQEVKGKSFGTRGLEFVFVRVGEKVESCGGRKGSRNIEIALIAPDQHYGRPLQASRFSTSRQDPGKQPLQECFRLNRRLAVFTKHTQ